MRVTAALLAAASLSIGALSTGCAVDDRPRPTSGDLVPERHLSGEDVLAGFAFEEGWRVSDVLDAPERATRVGLFLDVAEGAADRVLRIEARGVRADGTTTAWRPATFTWVEHPLRVGRVDLGAVVDGAQIRIAAEDAEVIDGLTFSAVVPEPEPRAEPRFDRSGSLPLADVEVGPQPFGSTTSTVRQGLDIAGVQPRSAWGARPTRCSSLNQTKTKISVHHTVTPSDQGGSAATFAQRIRGIQAYHMDSNGWCDIGYHFMVTIDGTTWEAREAKFLGTHVGGNNTNNAGVSFIGCFHTSGCSSWTPFTPPQVMIDGGGALIGKIAQRYGISISSSTVIGHRDNPNQTTSCPGDNLHSKLAQLRTIAQNGATTTTPTTGKVQGVVWDLSVTTDAAQSDDLGARLAGATISVQGGGTTTSRAGDGYWSFDLAPGTYTFTATLDGYAPASREVQVTAGASLWASMGIAPVPTAVPLTVLVYDADVGPSAVIQNATVQATGADPAQTGVDGRIVFDLNAGEVTITAAAEGYEPGEVVETLVAGQPREIQLGLVPVAVSPDEPDEDNGEEPTDPVDDPVEEPGQPIPPAQSPPAGEQPLERVVIPAQPGASGGCTCFTGDPDGTGPLGMAALLSGLILVLGGRRRLAA